MTQDTPNSRAGSNRTNDTVLVSTVGAVRTISINRPKAHNSLNRELRRGLLDAFVRAAVDAEAGIIRAVILRAEGKAFCAGQDLNEQLEDMRTGGAIGKVVGEYNPMVAALLAIPVPVIASIPGPAAGAGWGLAMGCDLRVVSTAASFKGAFSGVGLTTDSGLSVTLVHAVGRSKALELLLLDEKISAERANDLGFVTQLVAPEDLDAATQALAERIASGPTASFVATKHLVKRATDVIAGASEESVSQEKLGMTADHLEAIQAFLDKCPPKFTGE